MADYAIGLEGTNVSVMYGGIEVLRCPLLIGFEGYNTYAGQVNDLVTHDVIAPEDAVPIKRDLVKFMESARAEALTNLVSLLDKKSPRKPEKRGECTP